MKLSKNKFCSTCGRYANRGVSVDAVIIKDNQVLLIQRGVEPNKGFWGTPGGYVGWDESTEDAVQREVKEETNLTVTKMRLIEVNSNPKRHPKQVINFVYRVEVKDGEVKHGDDAFDAKWFLLKNLPEEMALDHRKNIEKTISLTS